MEQSVKGEVSLGCALYKVTLLAVRRVESEEWRQIGRLGLGEPLPCGAGGLLLVASLLKGPSLKACLSPHRKCSGRPKGCLFLAKKCLSPSTRELWSASEGTLWPAFSGCCCYGVGTVAVRPRGQVGPLWAVPGWRHSIVSVHVRVCECGVCDDCEWASDWLCVRESGHTPIIQQVWVSAVSQPMCIMISCRARAFDCVCDSVRMCESVLRERVRQREKWAVWTHILSQSHNVLKACLYQAPVGFRGQWVKVRTLLSCPILWKLWGHSRGCGHTGVQPEEVARTARRMCLCSRQRKWESLLEKRRPRDRRGETGQDGLLPCLKASWEKGTISAETWRRGQEHEPVPFTTSVTELAHGGP